MSLTAHSPARITAELAINAGQGIDPSVATPTSSTWPVFSDSEPDTPDAVITIRDTNGPDYFRSMPTGEVFAHLGLQIRVRAITYPLAYQKASQLYDWMTSVYQSGLTIDGVAYYVHCFSQLGTILSLGKDKNNTRRSVVTFNANIAIVNR